MLPRFSLVDSPWVRVVRDGAPATVSLLDVLTQAHEIDDLDWSAPLEATAILGVLLAVVRDAVRPETFNDVVTIWRQGRLPSDKIVDYAAEHRDRFDLFGERPFFQVAGLTAVSGGHKAVSIVQSEVATGNNVPLFSSYAESDAPPLEPADAARRLIATHAWDTAAIKTGAQGDPQVRTGKTTGNPTGPLGQLGVVTLVGLSLLETILLNLPRGKIAAGDRPAWRADPPPTAAWERRMPLGDLDLATWQSRRIGLLAEDREGHTVVTGVLVCAGDRLPVTPQIEWRTAWRRVEKPRAGQPALLPRRLQPGRAGWRGLAAIVAVGTESGEKTPVPGLIIAAIELTEAVVGYDYPLAVQLVGAQYGNQSAIVEHVMSDRTPLPLLALHESRGEQVRGAIELMASQADEVARALNALGDNLRRALGGDKVPWDKGERWGEVLLQSLGADAHRMLHGLSREPDKAGQASLAWERLLRQRAGGLAKSLLSAVPRGAWLGHEISEGTFLRQHDAEAFFRAALAKALPQATAQLTSSSPNDRKAI